MYRKVLFQDLPKEDTQIWSCTTPGCKVWMRDNFAFDYKPVCRVCLSPMVLTMQNLPIVNNSNRDLKTKKKGVQIKPA